MLKNANFITTAEKIENERCNHLIFRKTFDCESPDGAKICVSSKGIFLVYINGFFVCKGRNCEMVADLEDYLCPGENLVAIHSIGLYEKASVIASLVTNDRTVLTDSSWKVKEHSGYSVISKIKNGFAEKYFAESDCAEFEISFFDDSSWDNAVVCEQNCSFEKNESVFIPPKKPIFSTKKDGKVLIDFGEIHTGRLFFCGKGKKNSSAVIRYYCEKDGYFEPDDVFVFSGSDEDMLHLVFERSFRFVEIALEDGAGIYADSICII